MITPGSAPPIYNADVNVRDHMLPAVYMWSYLTFIKIFMSLLPVDHRHYDADI